MTPAKFALRFIAVPLTAIVLVGGWALFHESEEADARQYASLVQAYPTLSPDLQREVADALSTGKLSKSRYADLMRDTLQRGYLLDWPAASDVQIDDQRHRLQRLAHVDGG